MAAGEWAQNLFQQAPPPSPLPHQRGQFHLGLAAQMTQHARRHEEPEAQALDSDLLLPAWKALEEHRQVVGQSRRTQRGFAGPYNGSRQRVGRAKPVRSSLITFSQSARPL